MYKNDLIGHPTPTPSIVRNPIPSKNLRLRLRNPVPLVVSRKRETEDPRGGPRFRLVSRHWAGADSV